MRLKAGDWLIFLGVAMLALWAGLAQYVDKPWGTVIDYLTLFVWAYAAPTVLTPVIQALERLSESPLRKGEFNDNAT